jgi:hypothetical protein
VPDAIDTHDAVVLAAHVQSRVVDTSAVPVPPAAGATCIDVETVTWHFDPVGAVVEIDEEPHANSHGIAATTHAALIGFTSPDSP